MVRCKAGRAIKMRIFWLLAVLWSASAAWAGPVLDFESIRVEQLAYVLFGEVLHSDYLIDGSVKGETVSVHLTLPDGPGRQVAAILPLMRSVGVAVDSRAGVYFLSAGKPEVKPDIPFIYRPRWRSVSYLVDLVSPLFKPSAFALRRGVPQALGVAPGLSASTGGQSPAQLGGGAPAAGRETVTNSLSLMDKAPDVLVFKGTDAEGVILRGLLAQLDTATPEVMVKAVVYEVQHDSVNQTAVGMAVSLLGGKLGASLGSVLTHPGDVSAVFRSANLQMVLDALSTDNHFKVVTSPNIRVLSGATAKLLVGNQTPVVGAVQTSNGVSTQAVDYKPSGVILNLTPEIRGDVAELQIDQQISDFVTTTTGVNQSPTLVSRQLSTTVGVRGGKSVV